MGFKYAPNFPGFRMVKHPQLMSFFAFVIFILIGVGSLAFAYFNAGYVLLARLLLAFGALWVIAAWKLRTWVSSAGFLLLVALAGFGLWNELSPGWMISGTLGGLLAWDLSEFISRMDVAPEQADQRGMQRRHVARSTFVAVAGLLLASFFMLARMEFTFEWIMLLVLVAVLGAAQAADWLRRWR